MQENNNQKTREFYGKESKIITKKEITAGFITMVMHLSKSMVMYARWSIGYDLGFDSQPGRIGYTCILFSDMCKKLTLKVSHA